MFLLMKCVIFLSSVIFMQCRSTNAHSSTIVHENEDDDVVYVTDQVCILDNVFTFGLSIGYGVASLITLIGVSYWSFKNMSSM